jgi:hypothetical protein
MQGFLAAEQQLAVAVSLRPNAIDARLNLADVIRQAAECAPSAPAFLNLQKLSAILMGLPKCACAALAVKCTDAYVRSCSCAHLDSLFPDAALRTPSTSGMPEQSTCCRCSSALVHTLSACLGIVSSPRPYCSS